MKKKWSLVALALLLMILVGCYGPNDPLKPYPWHRAESWYCEQIQMTIQFVYDEDGNHVETRNASLQINNQVFNVTIGFRQDAIAFLVDEDGDDALEIVLDGLWIYRDGNMIVQIFDESIFDGQYSELIFVPCGD